MTARIAPEAGYRLETGKRAAAVSKRCATCGARLNNNRKTYCGPCYGDRLATAYQRRKREAAQ